MENANFVTNNQAVIDALDEMLNSPYYAVRKELLLSAKLTIVKLDEFVSGLEKVGTEYGRDLYRSKTGVKKP